MDRLFFPSPTQGVGSASPWAKGSHPFGVKTDPFGVKTSVLLGVASVQVHELVEVEQRAAEFAQR